MHSPSARSGGGFGICTVCEHAAMAANANEASGWAGDRAKEWVAKSELLERQLQPASDLLFAAAMLRPGERVLDVGCGTGPTTVAAAALVGSEGSVVGLDISADMVAAASTRDVPADAAPIEWVTADATTLTVDRPFDAVVSRFGVMFFDDPMAAFGALRSATRDGGRLAMAVWPSWPGAALFSFAHQVVCDRLVEMGLEPGPITDLKPFSLGDEAPTEAMLREAGWGHPALAFTRTDFVVGGGVSPELAAEALTTMSAARAALVDQPDDVVAQCRQRLVAALGPMSSENGVTIPTDVGVWTAVAD